MGRFPSIIWRCRDHKMIRKMAKTSKFRQGMGEEWSVPSSMIYIERRKMFLELTASKLEMVDIVSSLPLPSQVNEVHQWSSLTKARVGRRKGGDGQSYPFTQRMSFPRLETKRNSVPETWGTGMNYRGDSLSFSFSLYLSLTFSKCQFHVTSCPVRLFALRNFNLRINGFN